MAPIRAATEAMGRIREECTDNAPDASLGEVVVEKVDRRSGAEDSGFGYAGANIPLD